MIDNSETPIATEEQCAPPLGEQIVSSVGNVQRLDQQTREETIKLVQRLLAPAGVPIGAIVFSSVESNSGCSSVCARVAEIMAASTEGSICLVDANLRSPGLTRHFRLGDVDSTSEGEWTLAPTRTLMSTRAGGLWMLSHKQLNADWHTPRSLDRFQSALAELRMKFSHILIDAPPINAYADAALLGRLADGLVMVVEANKTRREAARRAKDILGVAGVRLLGVVLNKRRFPIPAAVYRRL